ncbi:MAG: acetylgalactosaminidase, partial [Bacteroidaceae bacterium]|nr:acetylgalactosaminidase [Bacteroidaceae bacterium]
MKTSRRQLLEYAVKPLPLVHIGIVGLGHRGLKAVERYALVEGAEIIALADRDPLRVEAANKLIADSGRP